MNWIMALCQEQTKRLVHCNVDFEHVRIITNNLFVMVQKRM